jgi:hypothetical protein
MSNGPRNCVTKLLDAVTATTESTVYGGKGSRVFQILITGTATVQMQASVDNTNWVSLGAAITASGGYESEAPWPYMRATVSSYTNGAVTVWVAD